MRRTADPEALLRAGLADLKLDPGLAGPLLAYLAQLEKWNAAYNLTAVRDPAEMVTRHLLDSLAVLPAIPARWSRPGVRLVDIGAGAGLPGIPLALARPEWSITLLDSNGKKARFLRHAQRALGLRNVDVIEGRAEAHQPAQPYDAAISRAFAALGDFFNLSRHLLAADGGWLAMKGRVDENEAAASVAHGVHIQEILSLDVPGLSEQRHLVVATPARPIPAVTP